MAIPFSQGSSQFPATNHNFVSYYNAHEPDVSDQYVRRYGQETLVGLFDILGIKKPTHSIEFDRFEQDRRYPKVKATAAGASAGAEDTFTIDSTSKRDIGQSSPYDTSGANDGTGVPVNVRDEIMIKPSSGSVSTGNYVHALVTSVDNSAGTFKAQPLDSSDSIPTISAAEEIVILGPALGEGGTLPESRSFTYSRFKDQLQIIGGRHANTGTEKLQKRWFEEPNSVGGYTNKFMIKDEPEAYINFLKQVDLSLLVGKQINNTALFDQFDEPTLKTKGLIHQIIDRGNVVNYSSISGMTIQDFYDLNETLDKQKGSEENMLMLGIALDQQLDQELGDRFRDGAVSYGQFNFDEEKKVALNFDTFRVGSYSYHKRKFDIFSDLQTLGAEGFNYPKEGMLLPMGTVTPDRGPEQGDTVSAIRKRYLEDSKTGENREMEIAYYDGFTQEKDGRMIEEVRYRSQCGIELLAANQAAYLKVA